MDRQRLQILLATWREKLFNRLEDTGQWLRHAHTRDVDLSTLKAYLNQTSTRLRQFNARDFQFSLVDLRHWLRQYGRKLSLYLALPITTLLLLLLIQQQTTRLNQALTLRPAQLTALESLIQDSKASASTDATPTFTDTDIETLRVILHNRGITPNILRLNLDQANGVEFQADQATFGQWVAFLEEVARRWHLFPVQLTIKATDSPGVVSIRAVLQQDLGLVP